MKFLFRLIGCLFVQVLISSSLYASDRELLVILETYNNNPARFHLNHRGKTFKGEGLVWEILVDPSRTGKYFIVDTKTVDIGRGSSLISNSVRDVIDPNRVRCVVYDMKLAASLNKKLGIHVSGVIDDVEFDNILILKDCKFQIHKF